jgi:hypothetical protein
MTSVAGGQATSSTALVKAFVNAITFLPVGSIVRTDRNEVGIVVRTNHGDPLHPVVALADDALTIAGGEIDTAVRDTSGGYERHVLATVRPPAGFDASVFLGTSSRSA